MTKNFIKVYDNVIPHSYCDDMIKKFELSKKDWVYKSVPQGEAKLGYKELSLSKNQDFWKNEIDYLTNVFVERFRGLCAGEADSADLAHIERNKVFRAFSRGCVLGWLIQPTWHTFKEPNVF